MFLTKQQPRGYDPKTKLIIGSVYSITTKREIFEKMRDNLENITRRNYGFNGITALMNDGAVIDGMVSVNGYQNILVVTSFEDSSYPRLVVDENPVLSAGDHMFPIIHKVNESYGNIYVTSVNNSNSVYQKLYDRYGVESVRSESVFRLDQPFKLYTDIKFDAVVILGSEAKGKHSINTIKEKFSKYCTEKFDLIDVYRGDSRTITGRKKSSKTIFDRMASVMFDLNWTLSTDRTNLYENFRNTIERVRSGEIYKVY
tara:strand:+ start:1281 stop:2051 length:771 start_codon:yes stop_codon:yes gene_type:complete